MRSPNTSHWVEDSEYSLIREHAILTCISYISPSRLEQVVRDHILTLLSNNRNTEKAHMDQRRLGLYQKSYNETRK